MLCCCVINHKVGEFLCILHYHHKFKPVHANVHTRQRRGTGNAKLQRAASTDKITKATMVRRSNGTDISPKHIIKPMKHVSATNRTIRMFTCYSADPTYRIPTIMEQIKFISMLREVPTSQIPFKITNDLPAEHF